MESQGRARLLAAAALVAAFAGAQGAIGGPLAGVGGGQACNPNDPPSCRYTSDLAYEVGVVDDLDDLVDPSRNDYRVPIIVRHPIGAERPRPLVIWHHGGDPAERCAGGTEEWGNLLAAAGYAVINPCRVFPDLTDGLRAQCDEGGFDDGDGDPTSVGDIDCQYWLAQYRYGAITTEFILHSLDDIEAADPALNDLFDRERIAVAGFSAGTAAVHANAGAWQQWTPESPRYEETTPEPIAFFAAGPQGPQYAGFGSGFQSADGDAGWSEHSWTDLGRPYMFVTGVGDETDEPPESRVAPFLTSAGNGSKYMLWNTSTRARHGTMNLNQCDDGVQAEHCEWIGSAGLAYFDAMLRDRHQAQKWLGSDALEILTDGAIELYRR